MKRNLELGGVAQGRRTPAARAGAELGLLPALGSPQPRGVPEALCPHFAPQEVAGSPVSGPCSLRAAQRLAQCWARAAGGGAALHTEGSFAAGSARPKGAGAAADPFPFCPPGIGQACPAARSIRGGALALSCDHIAPLMLHPFPDSSSAPQAHPGQCPSPQPAPSSPNPQVLSLASFSCLELWAWT